jgi:hypothetical protein
VAVVFFAFFFLAFLVDLVAVSVWAKITVEPARSERPRAAAIMIFFIEFNFSLWW